MNYMSVVHMTMQKYADDAKRLQALFDSGRLLHPSADGVSIIDFAKALHSCIGSSGTPLNANATAIKAMIGEPDHLVFALVDGFGMNFVDTLHSGAFIRSNLAIEMRSVFPSTTSAALTTLATGEWPATHAVTGWHVLLPQINAVSIIIGFRRSPDNKPLSQLGITAQDAYPTPSRMGATNRSAAHFLPKHIATSAYSTYWSDGATQIAYTSSDKAISAIIRRLAKAQTPSVTYLYMPQVDSAAHEYGSTHSITLNAARKANELLERLADALPHNARLVMTADHGHLDAPKGRANALPASHEIFNLCERKPSGDSRVMYATVRDENRQAFQQAVGEYLGSDFLTLDVEQVEAMNLLGQGPLSDETRRRIGNMLVLSTSDATLDFRKALGEESKKQLYSHHSGLTPAEMRIPLVIA